MTAAAMQMAGHEGVGATIVAGVGAAPVLEATEHVLDLVTEALDRLVVEDRDLAIALRWDAGCGTALDQRLASPVGVVAAIGEPDLGSRDRVKHERGASVVAHLAFAQQHDERASPPIADSVELGVQAPSDDHSIKLHASPFF